MRGITHNPGHLKHRLRLEAPSLVTDGLGGEVAGWDVVAHLWARVSPQRQTGTESADHLHGEATHEVLIRHRKDVLPGQRFVFRGRVLRILTCTDWTEETRFLVCLCSEEKP